MLELEGVHGISYSNLPILLRRKDLPTEERICLKEKGFAGSGARTADLQPVLIPLLCSAGKNQRVKFPKDSQRQANSLSIWQYSQMDRQCSGTMKGALSFQPPKQTNRLFKGRCQHWEGF